MTDPRLQHGTTTTYSRDKCRCSDCRAAWTAYHRNWRGQTGRDFVEVDRDLLSDLLHELFPMGLTDDCPARQVAA